MRTGYRAGVTPVLFLALLLVPPAPGSADPVREDSSGAGSSALASPVPGDSQGAAPGDGAEEVKRRNYGDPQPTLRLGFGASFAPHRPPATGTDAGFAFDVAVGVVVPVGRRVSLWPEVGYSLNVREARSGHFFIAGVAPMFGKPEGRIGVAPRLVVGDAWGASGVGLRTGLVASVVHGLMSLEVGHQWIRTGGRDVHDGRFLISVDVLMGLKAVAALIFFGSVFRKLL